MWTRAELKANAKQILRRTYWMSFLAMVIVGLLSGGQNGFSLITQLQDGFGMAFSIKVLTTVAGASLLYSLFLSNPLIVGKNYFFLRAREHNPEIPDIFARFGNGHYGNVFLTMLIKDVRIFLWSLLFLIPGIIKSYEYFFIPYILAENPAISYQRAFEISRDMTDGIKFQIFVLELSFFGWYLLGLVTFGIAGFFINPYVEATLTELYMAQRAKLLANYSAAGEELCGFDR